MSTKITIALAAAVLGAATAAFAAETPEHRLGDRYPTLDMSARQVVPAMPHAFAAAGPARHTPATIDAAQSDHAKWAGGVF